MARGDSQETARHRGDSHEPNVLLSPWASCCASLRVLVCVEVVACEVTKPVPHRLRLRLLLLLPLPLLLLLSSTSFVLPQIPREPPRRSAKGLQTARRAVPRGRPGRDTPAAGGDPDLFQSAGFPRRGDEPGGGGEVY